MLAARQAGAVSRSAVDGALDILHVVPSLAERIPLRAAVRTPGAPSKSSPLALQAAREDRERRRAGGVYCRTPPRTSPTARSRSQTSHRLETHRFLDAGNSAPVRPAISPAPVERCIPECSRTWMSWFAACTLPLSADAGGSIVSIGCLASQMDRSSQSMSAGPAAPRSIISAICAARSQSNMTWPRII